MLAAGSSVAGAFPASIRKALAIDPLPGSTWLDAEHIVILMQENRSFDHSYGTLRGVRGFNDPRAISLPNGHPVWCQTNARGETYAPFRLDIKDTKATWMSSLPHSWVDQTDARNGGKHDKWLDAKRSGNNDYAHLPLTLGYYSREDLPFYYAMADAFTVCDQNFCSSLTGTTPNRLYLWTGTIRERPSIRVKANVRNEDVDYQSEASWPTFPERLESLGISWRIYQNEISLQTGFTGEEDSWLANFTDNPLEWFKQYHVRFATGHRRFLQAQTQTLSAALKRLEERPQPWPDAVRKQIETARTQLAQARAAAAACDEKAFAQLPPLERNLHTKAFTTNEGDPNYRALASLTYRDGGRQREMTIPKGDVLHQFREDVRSGGLPTVSWIVAPQNFSDHPGAPWYGAWYLSEVLDILTQRPEVWQKTIFILCYDENDGYYDHVPPFVAPHPDKPETGKASPGMDTAVEQVTAQQEERRNGRTGPIGLGYRVPLVIASPWSRGGYVCSQVFDHTSILQCLEKYLSHKTGRAVREDNISAWRRAICGDLSSVFRPYNSEKIEPLKPIEWKSFAGSIHQAQFKPLPSGFKKLSRADIARAGEKPAPAWLPRQEAGTRPSCALPYELEVDGTLGADAKAFVIHFSASNERFGARSSGGAFHVYTPAKFRTTGQDSARFEAGRTWAYAVAPGGRLSDQWVLTDFEDHAYHLRVHGPNGFYREFQGTAGDPKLEFTLRPAPTSNAGLFAAVLQATGPGLKQPLTVELEDLSYGAPRTRLVLDGSSGAGGKNLVLNLTKSHGWYDFRMSVPGVPRFERRYAGRIETGQDSFSDPAMAGLG